MGQGPVRWRRQGKPDLAWAGLSWPWRPKGKQSGWPADLGRRGSRAARLALGLSVWRRGHGPACEAGGRAVAHAADDALVVLLVPESHEQEAVAAAPKVNGGAAASPVTGQAAVGGCGGACWQGWRRGRRRPRVGQRPDVVTAPVVGGGSLGWGSDPMWLLLRLWAAAARGGLSS